MSANIQKPLLNAFLQGDLRGNGKQITNVILSGASLANELDGNAQSITDLGGLAVGYNDTKEIWIGQRSSGKAGSGSKIDPYDGTTAAQFDTIMQTQLALAAADSSRLIVNLCEANNEYLTYGNSYELPEGQGWAPQDNLTLRGAAENACILKLSSSSSRFHWLIGGNYTQRCDGVTIENLTLDANEAAHTEPGASTPLQLFGVRNKVRNVTFIGYGSTLLTDECFLCFLQAPPEEDGYDCEIVDCTCGAPSVGLSWAGSNAGVSAFLVTGNTVSSTRMRNSRISGCAISNIPEITAVSGTMPYFHAAGMALTDHCVIEKMRVFNLTGVYGKAVAFYMDSFANKNATYRNNVLTNVSLGYFILTDNADLSGHLIENDIISLADDGLAISVSGGVSVRHDSLIVRREVIRGYEEATGTKGIAIYGVSRAQIYDNIIDTESEHNQVTLFDNCLPLAKFDNNRDLDGATIVPWNTDTGAYVPSNDVSSGELFLKSELVIYNTTEQALWEMATTIAQVEFDTVVRDPDERYDTGNNRWSLPVGTYEINFHVIADVAVWNIALYKNGIYDGNALTSGVEFSDQVVSTVITVTDPTDYFEVWGQPDVIEKSLFGSQNFILWITRLF